MSALNLEGGSNAVITCNSAKFCPNFVIEACPKLAVFYLEGGSLTVDTNCSVLGLFAVEVPISVSTDGEAVTVGTNCLMLGLFTVEVPVSVRTDSIVFTVLANSLILCLCAVEVPVSVFTDGVLVCIGSYCLVLGLFTVEVPVSVFADCEAVTVLTDCLELGLFTIEVPISVSADVIRKCVVNYNHTVAGVLSNEASSNKLVSIFASEVSCYLVSITLEDLTVCGNKSCIDVCICAHRIGYKENPLGIICSCGSDCTTVNCNANISCNRRCGSITDNDCCVSVCFVSRRVVNTGKVRVVDYHNGIVACDVNSSIAAKCAVIYCNVAAYGRSCNVESVLEAFCNYVVNSKNCRLLDNVDCTLGIGSTYNSKILNANLACAVNVNCTGCRGCESVSLTVKDDSLVENKSTVKSYVFKKNNCFACICSCKSVCKRSVTDAVDRCNSIYDTVCTVRIFNTSKSACAHFGSYCFAEYTAGNCRKIFEVAGSVPSTYVNVTAKLTACDRSLEGSCGIGGGNVGRAVYNNVATDCYVHTACIAVTKKVNSIYVSSICGDLTAGDSHFTDVLIVIRILHPNLTENVTAGNVDNVLAGGAVCKSTNGTALSSCDCATLNVENCVTAVAVGKVVNCELVNICSNGKALNSTALNGESSLLVADCGYCISPSSVCSTIEEVRNLTAANAILDDKVATVCNK